MKRIWIPLCLLSLSTVVWAGERTIEYQGQEVSISIPLGNDVVLKFDEAQLVGLNAAAAEYLAVESVRANRQVTLFGRKVTDEAVEAKFRGIDSNRIITAKVLVTEDPNVPDVVIIKPVGDERSSISVGSSSKRGFSEYWDSVDFNAGNVEVNAMDFDERTKVLVRYVNQLYGPKYAVEPPAFRIRQVAGFKAMDVPQLYRTGILSARAVDVYYGGGMTAVVFELTNTSKISHELTPMNIRGDWWSVQPWKVHYEPGESGVLVAIVSGQLDRGMFKAIGENVQ
ncbi:DUF3438 family protein [Vibrio vulnificus]